MNIAWLVKFIKEQVQQADQALLGEVTSVQPLRIRTQSVELDTNFLLIEESMYQKTQLDPPEISSGDSVLLLPVLDQQKYVVLAKVVTA